LYNVCTFHVPKINSFRCSRVVVYLSILSETSLRFSKRRFFPGVGLSAPRPTPNLEDQVFLFVWAITFDLSGLGDPASSYATTGLALQIIWPHKPHHYVKVETPSGAWVSWLIEFCVVCGCVYIMWWSGAYQSAVCAAEYSAWYKNMSQDCDKQLLALSCLSLHPSARRDWLKL
jgi:hypothetical protein